MPKKVGKGVVILLIAVLGGWQVAAAQPVAPSVKLAVVDIERVVANSNEGKALQAQIEEFTKQIQNEGGTLAEKARELRTRLSEGANSLSEERLAELQKQYEDATIALRRFQDDKQREGEKMRNEGLREIERKLQPVFEKIQEENGYDLILNNVPGVVVMARDTVDITQMVIDRFNSSASQQQ